MIFGTVYSTCRDNTAGAKVREGCAKNEVRCEKPSLVLSYSPPRASRDPDDLFEILLPAPPQAPQPRSVHIALKPETRCLYC